MGRGIVRLVCALAAALLAGGPAWATHGPRHGVEQVRFWHYGVEDGLSQSTARVLAQDRLGFLWIGTQDGLNRFDGQDFRVYRSDASDPHALPDNYITALAPAPDGSLWVGTQAGGLARYRPLVDDFAQVRVGEAEPGRRVAALLMDSGGRLWVANHSAGLSWFDPETSTTTPVPAAAGVAFGQVRSLRARRDGSVLVSARDGVWLVARDGLRASAWPGADGAPLDARDAIEVESGHVWVASASQGAVEFDDAGRELRRLTKDSGGMPDDEVNALLEDRAHRMWFGTLHGLARLDPGAGALATWHYDAAQPEGIASNRIHSLFEDRDGLIWIGTWQNGFSLFNPRTEAFVEIEPKPGDPTALPGAGVAAVAGDPDGTLWLGVLEGGGLVHFDLERGVLARYTHEPDRPESLSHTFAGALARGPDGTLWVGTSGGGLNRLRADGRGFDHFRHDPADPDSIAGNSIEALLVDREGNLWLGMDDVGLEMLCRGCDRFAHFPNRPGDPTSVGADTLNAVLEDRDGAIWVGLRPGGLARLDRATGRFEHYRANPSKPASLSHDTVSALYQDLAGRFWVGTQGGGLDQMLREADGSVRFRGYTSKHGLGSDAIGGIAEDRGGRIWVSTSTGISRLEPDTGRITNYDRRDGAQARGYYIGATGRMADGRVVFGGLRGATVFDPDQVGADLAPRAVAMTSIRGLEGASDKGASVAGWQADAQGPWLRLPHSTDAFAAEFSALHFSAPHRVRYSYRLSGLGEQWIETDSRRRIAMYTGLPPGEFRFEVRARSGDGPWSEATGVRVRHMPSPWQTLWARAALVLVLAGVTGALAWELRSRLRERRHSERRLKQSEERLKLALWGSGNELWDMDLVTHAMRRSNPLQHVEITADDYVADVRDMRRSANAEDLSGFDRAFADHVSGRSEHLDAVYRVRDLQGEWRWLRSRGRIVQRDAEGKALRMVGTTEDITALKEHELALERINQDLERRVRDRTGDLTLANEQLTRTVEELRQAQRQLVDAEKMAALGGLVAGIAHEINTPLGISVTAASHLESEARRVDQLRVSGALEGGELEAYQQTVADSTQMILRNLQRADKLVKSFKQVAVDQSSEQRRNIDLSEYIEEILTSLHPALKRTKHTVIVDCPERIVLDTYPGAIYQIVVNLAMNSLLHGFEGVEHGTIAIKATREAGSWVLDYRDDGRGMSEEVRRRVFEPFFTTRRGQGGSGLGLHIVFNLTHQVLLGTLRCESEPGKGARFVLRCPIEPVP